MHAGGAVDWLPPGAHAEAQLGLVCIPHAGAMHSVYFGWQSYFRDCLDVRGVAMPGRGARFKERAVTQMQTLVDEVVTAIHSLPWRELAVFGDCSGSITALAIAKALHAAGRRRVRHLFVAGIPDPTTADPTPRHVLSDDEFGRWAVHNGLLPPSVLELRGNAAYFLQQMRADFRLVETYQNPPSRLDCPITTFVGNDDRLARESFAAWATQTESLWQHQVLPSGHLVSADPSHHLKVIIGELLELSHA